MSLRRPRLFSKCLTSKWAESRAMSITNRPSRQKIMGPPGCIADQCSPIMRFKNAPSFASHGSHEGAGVPMFRSMTMKNTAGWPLKNNAVSCRRHSRGTTVAAEAQRRRLRQSQPLNRTLSVSRHRPRCPRVSVLVRRLWAAVDRPCGREEAHHA